jgi:hypothetical protein
MALLSLLMQFRIGIRLDATSVLIPSRLSPERPAELVQSDAESGLLVPRPLVAQAPAEPLQCTRLRFQFGRHLPKHFVEWEGLHARLQVSLHPVGRIFGEIMSVLHNPCVCLSHATRCCLRWARSAEAGAVVVGCVCLAVGSLCSVWIHAAV